MICLLRHVSVVSSIDTVLLQDLLWWDEVSLAHMLAVDVQNLWIGGGADTILTSELALQLSCLIDWILRG